MSETAFYRAPLRAATSFFPIPTFRERFVLAARRDWQLSI
jgi:hypothetical protein